jgi:hypothetical protein
MVSLQGRLLMAPHQLAPANSSKLLDLQGGLPHLLNAKLAAHRQLGGGLIRATSSSELASHRRHGGTSDSGHGSCVFGHERLGAPPSLASRSACGGGKSSRVTTTMMQTSRTSEPFDLDGESAAEIVETGVNWFSAFWRFTRPHTIIGSALGVTSVSLLAMESVSDLNLKFVLGLLKAVIPALCMNVYIVGLNQLYDIEIDKVNKPNLPLASGEFSVAAGVALVTTFAAVVYM